MNSLYFSPSLDGHRASHCQYFVKILSQYCEITNVVISEGQFTASTQDMLHPWLISGQMKVIQLKDALNITLNEFVGLQRELNVKLTIIQEPENHLKIINQQLRKGGQRLQGKTIGIFLRSNNYIYRRQLSANHWSFVINEIRRVKHLPQNWDHDPILFHEFLLSRYRLLDQAVCLDEFFVKEKGQPNTWMPDIYFGLDDVTSREQGEREVERFRNSLEQFLDKNQDRERILYFGSADFRKGYDTLLKLAVDENACFIHCGLKKIVKDATHCYNTEDMRNQLAKEMRLFEIDQFLVSRKAVDMFFSKINFLVLPYRRHLGSSGSMLLALSCGKPVLVPGVGLMAKRVFENNLGLVFGYEDYADLRRKFADMRKQDVGQYQEPIHTFMAQFGEEKTLAAIQHIVTSQLH